MNTKSAFLKHLSKLEKAALTETKRELMYELVGKMVEREVRAVMRKEGPQLQRRVRAQFRKALRAEIPVLVKKAVENITLYVRD